MRLLLQLRSFFFCSTLLDTGSHNGDCDLLVRFAVATQLAIRKLTTIVGFRPPLV